MAEQKKDIALELYPIDKGPYGHEPKQRDRGNSPLPANSPDYGEPPPKAVKPSEQQEGRPWSVMSL